MKMTADLADAQVFAAFPKDWYTCRTENASSDPSGLDDTKKGHGKMAVINLIIDAGEYADKKIFPPYRVLVGGTKEDGSKHDLGRCFQLVNATRITWTHETCGFVGGNGVEILQDTKVRKWLCPNCKQTGSFIFDTDHFFDKRIKVLLDQEKGLTGDDMVNSVSRVAPLS